MTRIQAPSSRAAQILQQKEISRSDVDALVQDVVADKKMTKAEKAVLREAMAHPGVTDEARDALQAFLGMRNAGVRNFIAAAGADGKIDAAEAKGLMEMMIESKGISKREQRSVKAAMRFVEFTDSAIEIIARGELPPGSPKLRTLDDLEPGKEYQLAMRSAGGSADFNVAYVVKDPDSGEVSIRLGESPAGSWGFGDTTVTLNADGKGQVKHKNLSLYPHSRTNIYMSAEVNVVDGELQAKFYYGRVVTAEKGGATGLTARYVGEQDDNYDPSADVATVWGRYWDRSSRRIAEIQITDDKVYIDPEGPLAKGIEIQPGGVIEAEVGGLRWRGQLTTNGELRLEKSERFGSSTLKGKVDSAMMAKIRPLLFADAT